MNHGNVSALSLVSSYIQDAALALQVCWVSHFYPLLVMAAHGADHRHWAGKYHPARWIQLLTDKMKTYVGQNCLKIL